MTHRLAVLIVLLATVPAIAHSQGPLVSYFVDPATELSWASCHVYLEGGSKRKLPFLPLISNKRAPLGTETYARDIRVDAPIVFAGDGVVSDGRLDPYQGLNVAGHVVLIAYDVNAERLEDRVRAAAVRMPAAVVLFSTKDQAPFPFFRDDQTASIPEIPAIVIGRAAAETLFAAAGLTIESARPGALIARLSLRIEGAFVRREGPNFTFAFQPGIDNAAIDELAALNEKSVAFIVNLFTSAGAAWRRSFVAYFRDFDAKVFYTHHWGRGLASDAGVFNVFNPSTVSLGLAVHENTHTLLTNSWSGTSSFFNEGFARYAESLATMPDRDHQDTRTFLASGQLAPLADLVRIDIGSDPRTSVAYPAAGSFVAYLVKTFGLEATARAWRLEARSGEARAREDTWTLAFKRPLSELERDWRAWLGAMGPSHG